MLYLNLICAFMLGLIWQIATEADLGFAGAYINGDFSFVDKKEGLLNLFMVNKITTSSILLFFSIIS